jgi:uncharacterized protein
MKRYMVYLFNDKFKPEDARDILKKARNLAIDSNVILRDVRVATDFLEIDVSIPDDAVLPEILSLLGQIGRVIEYQQIEEKYMEKKDSIDYARILFNSQKYWRAHEVLEAIWKRSEDAEKQILNAIILISAAFVHYQKNENNVCISILERALQKLDKIDGIYYEIDLDRIKAHISKNIRTGIVERTTI